jgi:uncharacterized membrane protein YsdA (DUF1294 family)/cold shock CspA family protein
MWNRLDSDPASLTKGHSNSYMQLKGTLKSWNDERGFGFLEPAKGGEDIFVHVKAFRLRAGRPQIGQILSFEVELGPQGKKRAKNVEPFRSPHLKRQARESSPPPGRGTLVAIPLFLILYVVVSVLWGPPVVIAVIFVAASFVTYFVYASDKLAAQRNDHRTPESTLHLLALAGGWPGALVAQQYLRHKSRKTEFRIVFWATVILNILGFLILCSPLGHQLLTGLDMKTR